MDDDHVEDDEDDDDDDDDDDSKLSHSESLKLFGWEMMNADTDDVASGWCFLEKKGPSNCLVKVVSTQIIGLISLLETEIFL